MYKESLNINVKSSLSFPGMAVSVRGLYFVVTLFLGSFFGSIFMLGPVLPLMLLSPSWYRWITDRIVATWLTLPVVSHLTPCRSLSMFLMSASTYVSYHLCLTTVVNCFAFLVLP